jgi:hypothetical protein
MRTLTRWTAAAVAAGTVLAGAAVAQPAGGRCLDDLGALDRRMDGDGFWLSGYRASLGWTGVATPAGTQPNLGLRAPGLAGPELSPGRDGAGAPHDGTSPFAGVNWQAAPAQALRTLFGAAQVLGQSGREEACRAVLTAAEADYEGYVAQLRQAGSTPAWRQKQIALARPVAEAGGLPTEAIEGTELRSPADERLGQVADIVLDSGSGEPVFVVIARGGFLGIGREHVAVPWRALRVTPGMDTFVLDATPRQMAAAPRLDRGALGAPEGVRLAEEIRGYWAGQPAATGGTR